MAERPETGLVRLDPNDRAQLEAFADLHEATLERMFEYFREEGFDAVEGTTDRSNGPALILYRTMGFRVQDRGFEGGAKIQVRYELRPV
jgi:hypothetical protein